MERNARETSTLAMGSLRTNSRCGRTVRLGRDDLRRNRAGKTGAFAPPCSRGKALANLPYEAAIRDDPKRRLRRSVLSVGRYPPFAASSVARRPLDLRQSRQRHPSGSTLSPAA